MNLLSEILQTHRLIISFIHPLVFFLMGFAIFLKNKTYSRFYLTNSLKYIGLFGIVHSFADWGDLFIPLQSSYLSVSSLSDLESVQLILNALSFTFLLYFGLHLLYHSMHWSKKLLVIPPVLFLGWLADLYVVKASESHSFISPVLVSLNATLDNYLIVVPAGLLSAAAIYLQKVQFEQLNMSFMKRSLMWTAISIITYTFSDTAFRFYGSGFVIPISSTPIEIFRALNGAVTGILIMKILQVVDIEYHRYLEEAQRNKVLSEERNRIARDLHDGMIQSIYAFGLELDSIRFLLGQNDPQGPEKSVAGLRKMTERINGLIAEIRGYISELLTPLGESPGLEARITHLVEDIVRSNGLSIDFTYTYSGPEPPLAITLHFFYITREALSNVIKHSRATQASVTVTTHESDLVVQVCDNGIGLHGNTQGTKSGLGISNIYYRADAIGGTCRIESREQGGTIVEVRVHTDRLN